MTLARSALGFSSESSYRELARSSQTTDEHQRCEIHRGHGHALTVTVTVTVTITVTVTVARTLPN
jgi:hypothetical protein